MNGAQMSEIETFWPTTAIVCKNHLPLVPTKDASPSFSVKISGERMFRGPLFYTSMEMINAEQSSSGATSDGRVRIDLFAAIGKSHKLFIGTFLSTASV
jgi:hypothetical protein